MSWIAHNPEFFDEFVAKSVLEGKVGAAELLAKVENGELFDYEIFALLTEEEQMSIMRVATEAFYEQQQSATERSAT